MEIPLLLHNLRLTQVQATRQRRRSLQLLHQRQLLQNLRRVKRRLLLKRLLLRRFLPAQQTVGGNSIAIDNSNIKHIRVDGVDFDLTQSGGVSLNNWKGKVPGFISGIASGEPKSVQKFLVNTASANATAGVLEVNGKKQAFFSGHFTPAAELPKGQVHYNTSVASMHSGANYNITRTELTANFDSKKLTGTISRNAEFGGNIAVNAQISGNKFDQSGATQVKGGFFGKNAAEVAGGFSSGNTVGAFVGSKK